MYCFHKDKEVNSLGKHNLLEGNVFLNFVIKIRDTKELIDLFEI